MRASIRGSPCRRRRARLAWVGKRAAVPRGHSRRRVALDAVVGAHDGQRRLVRVRGSGPRRRAAAGRARRRSAASRSTRCALSRRCSTVFRRRRGARRARRAASGRRPATHVGDRLAHRLAVRLAYRRLVVGRRIDPDRDEHDHLGASPRSGPSATASSTPCAIPSWAAPHVIVWWRSSATSTCSSSASSATRPYSPAPGRRRRGTACGPGAGRRAWPTAAAAVGRASPREDDVDVAAVRDLAAPALADPAVQVLPHAPSSRSSTTRSASPARIRSNASATASSGSRCETSRSSGSRPRR